jgi:2Fe-2S ferredoxin
MLNNENIHDNNLLDDLNNDAFVNDAHVQYDLDFTDNQSIDDFLAASSIKFKIVFPNSDEIDCIGNNGDNLLDCINAVLQQFYAQSAHQDALKTIALDNKFLQTCIVRIDGIENLTEPTPREHADLRGKQNHEQGYRYAHTYIITPALHNAFIFLNVLRVFYRNKAGVVHILHAYINESMTALRERQKDVIDRAFSCGGAMSCSSCHIFVGNDYFNRLNSISLREEDLLDCASSTSKYSRLGCAINFKPEYDKINIVHPQTRDALSHCNQET